MTSPTKSLYVGELDPTVSEATLFEIFNMVGPVASIRVCRDTVTRRSFGYAYVRYLNAADGERALDLLNNSIIKNRPWHRDPALQNTSQGNSFIKNLDESIDNKKKAEPRNELAHSEAAKQERQNKYAGVNLYVKNLDGDVDDEKLRAEFEAFGTITSCKVMRNERGISKEFAFVCFSTPEEATRAVAEMNNKKIGSKPLYVSIAQRRDVRRQQFEDQIMQRNQMRMQQAPIMGPGYVPPQINYGPGLSGDPQPAPMFPRGRYPPGQPMSSTQTPVSHTGGAPPQGNSSRGGSRSTPLHARPVAPFSNKINTPPPTSDIDARPTGSPSDISNLNEVDEDNIYSDRESSADETRNNQNTPPGDVSDDSILFTYPKDTRYYQPDGSGVFLVDGVLFKLFGAYRVEFPYIVKVQATAIFGSRPKVTVESNKGFTPVYLEDILPRLPNSSIEYPIELFGITKKQFRTYLLLITGLPCDEECSSLFMDYLIPEKHSQHLFLRYLDIMVVAPRLGMTRLEEWATNAFGTIFTDSILSFCENPYDWHYDDLLRLIELTRKTTRDTSARVFAQYLIYRIARDARHDQSADGNSSNITSLVEIYQGFKRSHNHNTLLGCVFLNVLSLGHRSRVWASLTRDDKAILYVAQAQLTDLPHEFAPGSFAWLTKPSSEQTRGLCAECESRLSTIWSETFGECSDRLGSNTPLKDVLILAEMPKYCRALWSRMDETDPGSSTALSSPPTTLDHTATCSIRLLVRHVDQRIQNLYEQAASRYWVIVEEFQAN
ncbi:Polyadenylate-binding protein, cytoplasmic and nuclear [Rhizoctonia solani]|uniref:Polyadenylate-binding protein, cytoplasmic and nuclear n=1 Tax=Rhizoctonia solani TaxID=456999 RepID=A0A0K6GB30_9AGAM|nr:Polyadenylate-binding protein, cytoplasmic and nuclear [Rhizoctonia solani]